MQRREFNRATIRGADRTDISGRATADEINGGLRTGKEARFWRIASLTFLGPLTVAGLLVVVAPLAVRADNDEDSRHGREDNDRGIRAEITALQAQVASLQSTVSTLQGQVNSLQTSNTTLQSQLAHAKNVLALDPFVSVDPNPEIGVIGPNITFSGANIHIVSGSGATDDRVHQGGAPMGLGNLIIGYDEPPAGQERDDRRGSHNLVIGRYHRFNSLAFGGLVAGELNAISALGASVSGGRENSASGEFSSVSGGLSNRAGYSPYTSVSGGSSNIAAGESASVSGGFRNVASAFWSSVSCGQENRASGNAASILGGVQNTASGGYAIVTGGQRNTASGFGASVNGGGGIPLVQGNTASGDLSVVLGGTGVTNNKANSIAPQPPFP
jgi:hypothetical protein